MNIIQKTIVVYSFDELTDAAKKTAIENVQNLEFYHDFMNYDCITEDFKDILKIIGFYNVEVHWSGFWNPGDGASFTASYSYEKGFLNKIKSEYKDAELIEICTVLQREMRRHFYKLRFEIYQNRHFYSHSNTMSMSYEHEDIAYYSLTNSDEEMFLTLFRDLADWFYSILRKQNDYLYTDECTVDYINAYDLTFNEQGEINHD